MHRNIRGDTEYPHAQGWFWHAIFHPFWMKPTAACFEWVRRLARDGVIQGYMVRLGPAKLERALLIFVEITLDRTSDAAFAEAVCRTPDILECHMMAGGFDYLIKARVRDMAAYRAFLGDTLVRLPGIRQTHTYTVMEEVKGMGTLPL